MDDRTNKQGKLWNINFFLLWQGQFVSAVGDVIYEIALGFWVLAVTGSTGLMGTLMAAATIPRVIIAPFAGVLVDRSDRKWLLVIMDAVRGIAILAVAMAAYAGVLEIWMVFAAGIVIGTGAAHVPRKRALVHILFDNRNVYQNTKSISQIGEPSFYGRYERRYSIRVAFEGIEIPHARGRGTQLLRIYRNRVDYTAVQTHRISRTGALRYSDGGAHGRNDRRNGNDRSSQDTEPTKNIFLRLVYGRVRRVARRFPAVGKLLSDDRLSCRGWLRECRPKCTDKQRNPAFSPANGPGKGHGASRDDDPGYDPDRYGYRWYSR